MVWMLLAIPLSSVIVGMIMLTLAITSYSGLVVDDYYKRGMQINRTLERDATAARYAMASDVRFVEESSQVVVTLEADSDFLYPDSVILGIYHAVKPGQDKEIELRRISDKVYAGPVPEMIPGKWYSSLYTNDWRLTGRIDWPSETASFTTEGPDAAAGRP